jgi:hypothetical protein
MTTINDNQRQAVLVKKTASATLHLIVGSGEIGTVYFACEQAPLMTFGNHGLPPRCPICRIQNPLRRKPNEILEDSGEYGRCRWGAR